MARTINDAVKEAAEKYIDTAPAGTAASPVVVTGAVAHDAVDSGAGIKIMAKANSGGPTNVAIGDRTDVLSNVSGMLAVCAYDGLTSAGVDGRTALMGFSSRVGFSVEPYPVLVGNAVFNNVSWDRQRGDVTGTWVKEPPVAKTDSAVSAASTTSQQLFAANATRSKLIIQNQDAAINIFINIGATAVAGANNLRIAPGDTLELAGTTGAVNVIAASGTPAICAWQF